MYRDKNCVNRLLELVENEVKYFYVKFMARTEIINVLKVNTKKQKKCLICLKESDESENRKAKDQCHYIGFYGEAAHNNFNLKYQIQDQIPVVVHTLSALPSVYKEAN